MPSPIFSSSFGSSIVSPPPPLLSQPLNFSNGSLKYDQLHSGGKLETKFEPNLSTQQQMQKLEQQQQAHHHQQQQQAAKYLQQQSHRESPSPTLMVEHRENSA